MTEPFSHRYHPVIHDNITANGNLCVSEGSQAELSWGRGGGGDTLGPITRVQVLIITLQICISTRMAWVVPVVGLFTPIAKNSLGNRFLGGASDFLPQDTKT